MTDTAQQLWDQTSNYRRKGGPDMPKYLEAENRISLMGGFSAAILRDHGLQFLVENGHRPDPHIDTPMSYSCSWQSPCERHDCPGHTMLAAINAAIGAVLDARKGEKP